MASDEWRVTSDPRHVLHRSPGFTLVELALVCVIIGILMAAILPSFQRTTQRLRIEQLTFELAQLLRTAHARAVSEGQDVLWTWDDAAHRARIAPADPAASQDPGTALASSRLPDAVAVSLTRDASPVGCACIRFFPDGTSEATAVSVTLQPSVYTVTVDEATSQVVIRAGRVAR